MPLTVITDLAVERVGRAGWFCEVVANKPNGGRQSIAPRSWSWRQVSDEFAHTQPHVISIAFTTQMFKYTATNKNQ